MEGILLIKTRHGKKVETSQRLILKYDEVERAYPMMGEYEIMVKGRSPSLSSLAHRIYRENTDLVENVTALIPDKRAETQPYRDEMGRRVIAELVEDEENDSGEGDFSFSRYIKKSNNEGTE